MSLPSLRHPAPLKTVIRDMADHRMSPATTQHPVLIEKDQAPATTRFWTGVAPPRTRLPQTPAKDMQTMLAEPIAKPMMLEPKKTCDISNLMSPPEAPHFENFSQVEMAGIGDLGVVGKRPLPNPPLSPPVSPPNKAVNPAAPAIPSTPLSIQDPILYPTNETASSPPAPLFVPTDESRETINERLVDEHIASRPASLFREATPPRREDYELALYFKSNCLQRFTENPLAYLRKERELLRADRKNTIVARPMMKLPPILPASRPAALKPQPLKVSTGRIQKPKSPKMKTTLPRQIRATPAVRQTIRVSSTPEPRVRTVAPNREDKDFASLPDYCPPLQSLPNKPNSLKVDWKGNALDLSKDPHAYLLHPDELLLAAGLRLDCATYLTSKRRIFIRRLECAKIRKEFRKTDAQQACKIDVNKASKLWTAYEKVGWLDLKWMDQFL